MRGLLVAVAFLPGAVSWAAEQAPTSAPPQVQKLLDQALTLAKSVPDRAERADAVGRVAAELARYDPKQAMEVLKGELDTHEESLAMASAAEALAHSNRLLGLATLMRISDVSTVMAALSRIVALEVLADFDEALTLSSHIELLTVRRMVEREVTRTIWADTTGDRGQAVDTAVRWAQAISDPVTRYEALAYAAEGAATTDLARAQEIAQGIPDVEPRDLALGLIVKEIAVSDPETAQNLLGRMQTPLRRNLAGARAVAGLVKAGRGQEALTLVASIRKSVAEDLENPLDQSLVREQLAPAIVGVDPATALSIASEVWPPAQRHVLQCRLATSLNATDPKQARELLEDAWVEVKRTDAPLFEREIASAAIASAVVVAPDLLDKMAEQRPQLVQEALPAAVRSLAEESPEVALDLSAQITDPAIAEQARAAIVSLAGVTHPEIARNVAESLQAPGPKSAALVALAAAARAG
jgi:hypothetical protein